LGWLVRSGLLVVLVSLGLIAGGLLVARHDRRGEPATATVLSCESRYKLPPLCRGQWIAGGSLLEGGRVVTGTIDGVGRGDIGDELAVRASGETAWTVSKRIPVLLIAAGAALALTGVVSGVRGRARRA
jgi:hypothetical protein